MDLKITISNVVTVKMAYFRTSQWFRCDFSGFIQSDDMKSGSYRLQESGYKIGSLESTVVARILQVLKVSREGGDFQRNFCLKNSRISSVRGWILAPSVQFRSSRYFQFGRACFVLGYCAGERGKLSTW